MKFRSELKNYQQESHYFRLRLWFAALLVLVCFGILVARMIYLQMIRHEHFHTLAESNRISLVPIQPNRGMILDKNGVTLAHNFFVYSLEITPARVKDIEKTINQLSTLVSVDALDRKRFKKILAESEEFESVPLRTHLNEAEAARFAVNRYRFPGVEIKSRLFRHYPQGKLGSHLVGYIGRINDKDIEKLKESEQLSNYKGSDHIGKTGLEHYYESTLHGKTGFKQVEVDSGGHAVRVLSSTQPVHGDNLILSVDSKLQKIGEDAFGDRRGALVAINPKNGEVLAYVSMPTFDSNLFVGGIDTENWKLLNESLDKPLINRPLRGIYPPGSTFKPFIALAGLEAGKRLPPFSIKDPGFFMLPGNRHRYRDWKPEGHGEVDMQKAITISCDTFFYGLAHEMGIHAMTDFVRHFGFGQKSGIDISGELEGLLPTPEWKKRRWNQPWYPGETVIFGIGQGYMLSTPMQLAQATAIFANKGVAMKPRIVANTQNARNGSITPIEPVMVDRIELLPENVAIVRKGMEDVTLPGGTAVAVGAGAPYTVAAKTGTAQVVGIKQGEKYDASKLDERHRDHALFIAYAPADDPKIALAVIVENGGGGGATAGPIARKVIDYYLLGKEPEPVDNTVTTTTQSFGPATAPTDAATAAMAAENGDHRHD
jgi:penicillin-binding protein 2